MHVTCNNGTLTFSLSGELSLKSFYIFSYNLSSFQFQYVLVTLCPCHFYNLFLIYIFQFRFNFSFSNFSTLIDFISISCHGKILNLNIFENIHFYFLVQLRKTIFNILNDNSTHQTMCSSAHKKTKYGEYKVPLIRFDVIYILYQYSVNSSKLLFSSGDKNICIWFRALYINALQRFSNETLEHHLTTIVNSKSNQATLNQ